MQSTARFLPLVAVVAAGGLVLAALAFGSRQASAQDQNLVACGVTSAADVAAAFPMEHASDLWAHLPNALAAPELQRPDPAFVVVFSGPRAIGGGGTPAAEGQAPPGNVYHNVVCVVIGGEPTYYANVDLTGLRP
jgi:hypothetical protein